MSEDGQVLQKLTELVVQQRAEIVDEATNWVYDVSVDLQGKRPRSETYELVTATVQAYSIALQKDDYDPLYELVEHVVDVRGDLMFQISTLQRGFGAFKKVVWPRFQAQCADVQHQFSAYKWLNSSYEKVLFRLSDRYQEKVTRVFSGHIEQVTQANNAKSAFLASMSHEIRTPLSTVMGVLSLLKMQSRSQGTVQPSNHDTELIKTAVTSSEHLLALIDNIIDFSRLEVGLASAQMVSFDPSTIALEVVALQSSMAESNGLELDLHELPQRTRVMGVPTRLRQVILNLVSNAIKFTRDGRVSVSLSAKHCGGNTLLLRCEVADTGMGVDVEHHETIFNAFEQMEPGITRRFAGAGLGLAICRRIVEQHNGRIGLESEPGKGSLFWFEIEYAKAADEPADVEDRVEKAEPSQLLSVLVVENHDVNREILASMLNELGHQARGVSSGPECIEILKSHTFALVFMDIHMPGMDGYEVISRVRSESSSVQPFIVALTADAIRGTRERCIEAGADDYLAKPVTMGRLNLAIQDWVKNSPLRF